MRNVEKVCNNAYSIKRWSARISPILLGKWRLGKISIVVKTIRILRAHNLFARENGGRWRRNIVVCLHNGRQFGITNVESLTHLRFLCRLSGFIRRSKHVLWLLAKCTHDSTRFFVLRNAWSGLMALDKFQLLQCSPYAPRAA